MVVLEATRRVEPPAARGIPSRGCGTRPAGSDSPRPFQEYPTHPAWRGCTVDGWRGLGCNHGFLQRRRLISVERDMWGIRGEGEDCPSERSERVPQPSEGIPRVARGLEHEPASCARQETSRGNKPPHRNPAALHGDLQEGRTRNPTAAARNTAARHKVKDRTC